MAMVVHHEHTGVSSMQQHISSGQPDGQEELRMIWVLLATAVVTAMTTTAAINI
jgi:hypothetical protein